MRYNVNPMFQARRSPLLGAMGADNVQVDSGSILNLGDDLRAIQRRLDALLQWGRQNPEGWKPIASSFMLIQNAVSAARDKYVYVYTTVFGNPPAGLGIAPIVVGAALAVTIAALIAEVYMQSKKLTALETQAWASQQTETNRATLLQQSADARARGDNVLADALLAQAGVPGTAPAASGKQDWSAWLQDNALPIGLIVGAVILVPKFLD